MRKFISLEKSIKLLKHFRLVILSLVDHQKYSKKEIMQYFQCTKYQVDLARSWKKKCIGSIIPSKKVYIRQKLDLVKSEHFLDYIFNSGLLQDVAYGVHSIVMDSGDKQVVSNAILTTKYSHVIELYKASCPDESILSDSSLWRILRSLKPSQRRCLGNDFTYLSQMFPPNH